MRDSARGGCMSAEPDATRVPTPRPPWLAGLLPSSADRRYACDRFARRIDTELPRRLDDDLLEAEPCGLAHECRQPVLILDARVQLEHLLERHRTVCHGGETSRNLHALGDRGSVPARRERDRQPAGA